MMLFGNIKDKSDKPESSLLADQIAEMEAEIERKHRESQTAQYEVRALDEKRNLYSRNLKVPPELLQRLAEKRELTKHLTAERIRLEREKSKKREAWLLASKKEKEASVLLETEGLDQTIEALQARRQGLEERVQNLTEQRTAVAKAVSDLQRQLSEAEQAYDEKKRQAILDGKTAPKNSKTADDLNIAFRTEKSKLSPLNHEINVLQSEIDKLKSEEREIDQRLCEREYLLLKSEFEEAGKPLLEAEQTFCDACRDLVKRWSALRERARACGKPFVGSRQPFPHRIGQHATDVAFTFASGRQHNFRVLHQR